ncbi:MAG: endonuclease/exonuclease/phosphatase family protein [Gemmatimonadales bacterium]
MPKVGRCWIPAPGRTAITALVYGAFALAASACAPPAETDATGTGGGVRLLSWNVSSDAFVRYPAEFRALVRKAQADILLLDEVAPSTNENELRAVLSGLESDSRGGWHIDFGQSGGRQRGVVASRMPLERLPEFSGIVPYPEAERRRLYDRMAAADELNPRYSMDDGIPVNGAVVLIGERRLLVVTADLQSRDDDPGAWREDRRRVEAREIRQRVRQVLERTSVDGIIVAGDFNLVSTPLPMVFASGPYPLPHAGLIAAELRHLDGLETWTNQANNFPNSALDFVLYGPQALELRGGYVLDTADLSPAELEQLDLESDSAHRLSSHRPLVAEFFWH